MIAYPNFVFIHIPKTAGSSVSQALSASFGPGIPHLRPELSSHPSWRFIPTASEKAPRFCIARDPWSWHASLYSYSRSRPGSLSPLFDRLSLGFERSFDETLPRLLSLTRADRSFCLRSLSPARMGDKGTMRDFAAFADSLDQLGFYGAMRLGIAGADCDALCRMELERALPAWLASKAGAFLNCPIPRINASEPVPMSEGSAALIAQAEACTVDQFGYKLGNPCALRGVWRSAS